MGLRTRIILLTGFMLIIVTLLFGIATFKAQENALLSGIDSRLEATARLAREIMRVDYHDKIIGADSVPIEEYLRIVDRWNRLCRQMGLEYIWSLMMFDGKIVFTSGSSTSKDVRNGDHAKFFETHSNPESYVTAFATMEPQYQTIDDKWGNIRVVLLPFKDAKGRPYLFGASMKTTEVEALMRKTIRQSLVISAGILFLGVFFSILFAASLIRPLEKLTDLSRNITNGDWGQVVEISGADEIRSLAHSVNEMSRSIQEKITERKQAEEKLRESELKYRSLFETSTQGILIYNRDGTIQMVNPSMMNLLHAKFPEEIVGRPYFDFVHSDDREESAARVKKIFQNALEAPGKIDNGQVAAPIREHRIIKTNGEVVNVESTGVALQYQGSTHIQGIFRDITERKRAEDALRESETKYRNLFDQATDGIMIMPVDGSHITVNESFAKLHGYDSPKELEYIKLSDLDTPETAKLAPERLQRVLAGEAMKFEVEHYHKDGNILSLDVACNIIQTGGKLYYLGFHKDITERKQAEKKHRDLEERLQRSEKMEALGTLAGGVAHDLNNVLGIVVGYSEMLLDEIDASNPLREDVMKIMEGGNRSAAIVQDLLTLARRGVQTQKVINLNDTISGYQETPEFEALFSLNRRIKLETDLETDLLNIIGSPVHLGKAFINLIANAVEAMTDGGILTIKTSNQSLEKPVKGYDTVNEGDYVVLSITDTGEGISENDIKHIFEPFYTKKVMGRSGTGLGLAVVWGTVKDHHGYINVQSEVGKGTTFTLYFPVTREEIAEVPTAVPLSEYIGNDESVLVIDDIKEQRELAAKMLGKLNYKVKSVSSGEEAIEYLRNEKVDLIVLDMIMDPGMDGLDTS